MSKDYIKIESPAKPELTDFLLETGYIGFHVALTLDESYVYSNQENMVIIDEEYIHVIINSIYLTVPLETETFFGRPVQISVLIYYNSEAITIAYKIKNEPIHVFEFDRDDQIHTDEDIYLGIDRYEEGYSNLYIRHIETGTTTNFNDAELLTKFRQLEL